MASCALALLAAPAAAAAAAPAAPVVRVDGARLVDGLGRDLQLRGVNRSGTEYACVRAGTPAARGFSVFDGPRYDVPNLVQPQRMIDAMLAWRINVVRIPLNEHCWLGDLAGLDPRYSGASYRRAIRRYVDLLGANGIYAILSLHMVGPDAAPNLEGALLPLPDADNAAPFWTQVARTFRSRTHVLYDAFNEPHLAEIEDEDARWACWRDGCRVDPAAADAGGPVDPPPYEAAGMRDVVAAIRVAGSAQPILLGGLRFANELDRWREHLPPDPARALVASFHTYPTPAGGCSDEACWDATVDAVRRGGSPVVTGEFGQYDCGDDYVRRYVDWADAHGAISYLAWTWDETDPPSTWSCSNPSVIASYDGTPTQTYGAALRAHLLARRERDDGPLAPLHIAPSPVRPLTPFAGVPSLRSGPQMRLRTRVATAGGLRVAIASAATMPAGPCVRNGEVDALRVTIVALGLGAPDTRPPARIVGLRVLVGGRAQRALGGLAAADAVRRGELFWATRAPTGAPLAPGSRQAASIEVVVRVAPARPGGRATQRRLRLASHFHVCG